MNKSLLIALIAASLHSFAFGMERNTNRERAEKTKSVMVSIKNQTDKELQRKKRDEARMADFHQEAQPSSSPAELDLDIDPRLLTHDAHIVMDVVAQKLLQQIEETRQLRAKIKLYQETNRNLKKSGCGFIDLADEESYDRLEATISARWAKILAPK